MTKLCTFTTFVVCVTTPPILLAFPFGEGGPLAVDEVLHPNDLPNAPLGISRSSEHIASTGHIALPLGKISLRFRRSGLSPRPHTTFVVCAYATHRTYSLFAITYYFPSPTIEKEKRLPRRKPFCFYIAAVP